MARRRTSLTLSAEAAHQALAFLIHEGKLATNEVSKALQRREKLVREIREKLATLGGEGLAATRRVVKTAEKSSRPARKRARRAVSRAARKIYQAQGRYMAALRPLSKAARKQIKSIRKKSGIDAAIKEAKKLYK
jgi:hypothetical protein